MSNTLTQVNRTKVSRQLLVDILNLNASCGFPECDGLQTKLFHIFEYLEKHGYRENQIPAIAMAIDLRLTALAELDQRLVIPEWIQHSPKAGAALITAEVLEAAAQLPLSESPKGEAVFDAEQFRQHLLANVTVGGHG